MANHLYSLLVLPLAVLFTVVLLGVAWQSRTVPAPGIEDRTDEPVPDFTAFNDIEEKKQTFFRFLLPKVRKANDAILKDRRRLLPMLDELDAGKALDQENLKWLKNKAIAYRVNGDIVTEKHSRQTLKRRVNIIPASLVLAQAANESGWGSARFARNGNNYFGLWCWQRNCGMVPSDRTPSKQHEVASFDTIEAGISYYLLTLNSHPAYQSLRDRRAEALTEGRPLTGLQLAEGLTKYSERGDAYVEEIQSMISYNQLQRFNR